MDKDYDFVIFGATGFTGKRVCEELHYVIQTQGYDYKWAIAGRNLDKLENVICWMMSRKSITEEDKGKIDLIEADVNDHKSLLNMCRRTKVVLDCVGPYKLYGEQVVKACVEGQSDYLDITGEPDYIDKINVKYSDSARESGVYVISACGFDSIPSDLGVIYASQQFGGTLNSIEAYFQWKISQHGLKMNHGTYSSMVLAIMDSNAREEYKKLTEYKGPRVGPRVNLKGLHYNSQHQCYAMVFSGPDMGIVRKSQVYIHENCNTAPVQYCMYMALNSILHLIALFTFVLSVKALSFTNWGKKLVLNNPGFFSCNVFSFEGPTEEQIKGTGFTLHMTGKGYRDGGLELNRTERPDKTIKIKVSGPELAYVTTPIVLVQAAVTLLLERKKLPANGGVYSTASAFHQSSIIPRMHERGVKFEVIHQDE